MNALFLQTNNFPLIPFLLVVLAGGIGFYCLMAKSWKVLDERTAPPPELLKAGECLKIQALERQGVLKNDAFGRQPELTFRYDDGEFVVSVNEGGKGQPRITFVTFPTKFFPDENFRIASGSFKALVSFSRIKSFNGDVCRQYDLEGGDGVFIRNLLTQEIQTDLLQYENATEARFGMRVGVKAALKPAPGRFYLSTEGFKIEAEDYNRLIGTAIKFYARLKTTAVEFRQLECADQTNIIYRQNYTRRKTMKSLFVLLIIFGGAACPADAQIAAGGNYTLDQSVIATGGGTSAGSTFTVEGTAGQAVAGTRQTNAPYNFYSGFWTAQVFAPTAASVTAGGRVVSAGGDGIRNVRVTLTGANGEARTVISGKLGYFRFNDVAAGETYIFSVSAKRYTFSQPAQVRSIVEDTDDIVFTADFRQLTVESF